jgi:hypothetical protein
LPVAAVLACGASGASARALSIDCPGYLQIARLISTPVTIPSVAERKERPNEIRPARQA